MKPVRFGNRFLWGAGLLLLSAVLLGCPVVEPPPVEPPHTPAEREEEPDEAIPEADPIGIPADPLPAVGPAEEATAPLKEGPADLPSEEPAPDDEPAESAEPVMEPEPMPVPEPPDDTAMDFPKPPEVDETWEMPKPEPWELGPPLVDNVDQLKPLDPEKPVWLDMENKSVVFLGKICQREVPLELFACLRYTKEHEAIVVADVRALTVHAGLLAVGAEPGGPVQFHPEYIPARGTEIEVTVLWKDAEGKVQTARAQDWIQNTETNEAMTEPWVFAGSGFWVEPTGEKRYQAEGGDFICVSNFATAMLDVTVESSQANQMLMYRAFTERIPPLETPVTLVLTPKHGPKDEEAEEPEETKENEQ
ncbi:MAG: YdjY domain-containing protein [Thermoguttaceae bacterium]|jgi:hypothetical protein|nr:YdjY domain-containing protein [Thermoguttaceae bacterium]